MRLNLGCGDDIRVGYVNVDMRKTHSSVMEVDLSRFSWPFEDGSAEEVLMLDFLEHFPYRDTQRILLECYRVLAPRGELVVQVPDAEILARALLNEGDYQCNRCGHSMQEVVNGDPDWVLNTIECHGCGQHYGEVAEAAMKRLYGGQDFVGNFHHTCFTQERLISKARSIGLDFLSLEEEAHQRANWNFKARFQKGDPWGSV